jgi:hypothetical protein
MNLKKTIFIYGNLDANHSIIVNNYHFVDENPFNTFKDTYTPTPGDILYIFPNSTIPRFKVKGFCEANNVSLTKNKEKANAIFANPSALTSGLFEQKSWLRRLKVSSLRKYLDHYVNSNDTRFDTIRKTLDTIETDFVLCGYRFMNDIIDGRNNFPKYNFIQYSDVVDEDDPTTLNNHWDFSYEHSHDLLLPEDNFQDYMKIINNSHNLYHQDALLKLINTGTVIDKELYQGLKSMLESTNKSDHVVAMEAMANADYLESAIYLLLLFKECNRTIFDNQARYHVNFKSLCNFFNVNYRSHLSIDYIVDKLKEKEVLTTKNLYMLLDMVTEEVQDHGDTDCFKMTGVAPIPELIEIAKQTDVKLEKPETIEEL